MTLVLAAALSGCARVPRDAGFSDVRATVAERTGGKRIVWNQASAADAAVELELRSLVGGDELTIDEAVQVALLNNRNLQAVYEDLMVAQADLVAAGLLGNPIFEAEIRFHEGGGGTGAELAVVQEFVGVFQIPLRRRIASDRFSAAKARVAGAAIDLAADVREAFIELQAAQQLLEMQQIVLEAADAAHDLARRLHDAGNITDLSLNLQRIQLEEARLDVASAESAVVAGREQLNVLLGLWGPAAGEWQVVQRLPDPTEQAQEGEGLEERAIANSLDLAALRHDLEARGRGLGLSRTFGLLPELEVGASAEREPDGEWAVGPAFALPIPLLNQGQPAVASAQAELRRAQATYYATAVELRAAARAAYARLQHARARATYYKEVLLPLRAQVVEQTQLEYNAMLIGAFELLQSRQQQVEAGAQYIEAVRDYWLARTALDTLMAGRLRGSALEGRASPMSGISAGGAETAGDDH